MEAQLPSPKRMMALSVWSHHALAALDHKWCSAILIRRGTSPIGLSSVEQIYLAPPIRYSALKLIPLTFR